MAICKTKGIEKNFGKQIYMTFHSNSVRVDVKQMCVWGG